MNHNERNPYIVGTPVDGSDSFFGREILLRNIQDNLLQNTKFILLHGQRRIGKSSVLRRISLTVSPDNFLFVYCDLQDQVHSSLNEIFYLIFREIFQKIELDTSQLNSLLSKDSENIIRYIRRLLFTVFEKLPDNIKLVLLLDEFDVVTYDDTEKAVQLLHNLEDLVKREEELFVVAVVGRYLNSMPSLLQVFKNAVSQEIGLLDPQSAEQLIRKPASNILQYEQETIEEICKFSSGHPFYTQALCYAIFQITSCENNINEIYNILTDDVVAALPSAIEVAEGGLGGFWEGLNIYEKVVIATVADAQESREKDIINNPLELLEDYGVVITNELDTAIKTLTNKGLLDSNPIKVKVEFVRRWLRERRPLRDEVRSLEDIEKKNVESLLAIAHSQWEGQSEKTTALTLYEQVLQLNPNNFSNVVELAEKYLQIKAFDKALELYERAYKVDKLSYQQEFIQALEQYGHWLITQNELTTAKQQYERIVQIEPDNSSAKQKLAEIKAIQPQPISNNFTDNLRDIRIPRLALAILLLIGAGGLLAIGRGFNVSSSFDFSNICLPIICTKTIEDSISSGDRTLFPNTKNPARDQGIKSFQEGQYPKAEEDFKKAVKYDRNDPEVLIYQNNALARQRGNPLTLAAVVPATGKTEYAKEMLRGIAQAQDAFNNQGLNGRLLRIVIADDAGTKEQAVKVAEKLVQDDSLLGVIGHISSSITEATLPIYAEANLAIISPTSTSTELRSSVFFRTVPSDKATGEKLAQYIFSNKLKKILIVWNPNDSYSRSIQLAFRDEFIRQFAKEGVDVSIDEIKLAEPAKMMQEFQNTVLDKQSVEAIAFFPDTNNLQNAIDFAKMIQQDKNLQKAQLLGGDSFYNEKAWDVEGLILAVPWFRGAEKSQEFANKAVQQWGGGVSWRTAMSFDATQAFLDSFRISNRISKYAVVEKLKDVSLQPPTETSGEPLIFDKRSSENQRKSTLLKVENRKFSVIPVTDKR